MLAHIGKTHVRRTASVLALVRASGVETWFQKQLISKVFCCAYTVQSDVRTVERNSFTTLYFKV